MIDPAYMAIGEAGKQAANMFVMGETLLALSKVAQETGCTIVIAHHLNESIKVGRQPALMQLAFSGFSQWMRQWMLLNRRKEFVTGSGRHELLLAAGGSAGHSSFWSVTIDEYDGAKPCWKVEAEPLGTVSDARQEQRLRIIKALRRCPDGETASRIRDRACLETDPAAAVLAGLQTEGLVEACQVRRKNKQSYPGFRLTAAGVEALGSREHSGGRAPE